jgi:RNA polymerase sigma factor (TIGR02999 family)
MPDIERTASASQHSPHSHSPTHRSTPGVTELLVAWSGGDRTALDRLLPIIYGELHRQAARALRREGGGHTLQPTALVNIAYLRLVKHNRVKWKNRMQFFGVAAQVIRRILIDHAREHLAQKRGGGAIRVTLEQFAADGDDGADDRAIEVLALHDALKRLAANDPFLVRLVELRYFAGLTIEETARAVEVSPATVKRDLKFTYAWLARELS